MTAARSRRRPGRGGHAQTDGNPFFVGEVVRLLASEGRLRDAERAGRASDPAGRARGRRPPPRPALGGDQQALRVAAAIGREFDGELLVEVAELSPEQLMTAAGRRSPERLVTDLGGGRYSFSHALVRDTLYEEAEPGQRSGLHERIGLALEEICGGRPRARLGELAHHFLAAAPRGDLARAIDYAERAGDRRWSSSPTRRRSRSYERALEALELSDEPDEARCGLLLALGGPEAKAARVADARAAFERAAASARPRRPDGLVGRRDRHRDDDRGRRPWTRT